MDKIIGSNKLGEISMYFDQDEIYYERNIFLNVSFNYRKIKGLPQGYFKYYVGDKMCRISFFEPTYIFAENGNSILTKEEITYLIDILKKEYQYKDYDGETNFSGAIKMMNWLHHNYDFRKLEDVWEDIPEDLPMPDYTLLERYI